MKLLDVPDHQEMESPSSWLMRVAFRQVVAPRELARYLGVGIGVDCEMAFAKLSFQSLASAHTSAAGTFRHVDLLMERLKKVDPYGERFLLRHNSVAYHRFCAACLATDRVKYFRLEWRFKCWRWCPKHSCLLLDCCPHCGTRASLPKDMCDAGPDGLGVATLDRCMHCAELLTTNWQASVDTLAQELTTPWEQALLNNGRAALAALVLGKVQVQGEEKPHGLRRLKSIERQGFLPHAAQFRLTHDEMMRRHEQSLLTMLESASSHLLQTTAHSPN